MGYHQPLRSGSTSPGFYLTVFLFGKEGRKGFSVFQFPFVLYLVPTLILFNVFAHFEYKMEAPPRPCIVLNINNNNTHLRFTLLFAKLCGIELNFFNLNFQSFDVHFVSLFLYLFRSPLPFILFLEAEPEK